MIFMVLKEKNVEFDTSSLKYGTSACVIKISALRDSQNFELYTSHSGSSQFKLLVFLRVEKKN